VLRTSICLPGKALIERSGIVPELFAEHDSGGTALAEPITSALMPPDD